jgi:hypothetical protein
MKLLPAAILIGLMSPATVLAYELDDLRWGTREMYADCEIIFHGEQLVKKWNCNVRETAYTPHSYAINGGCSSEREPREPFVLITDFANTDFEDKGVLASLDLRTSVKDDRRGSTYSDISVTWNKPCWSGEGLKVCVHQNSWIHLPRSRFRCESAN